VNDQSSDPTSPWVYLPADGKKCPRTGFSRATIYRLLKRAGGMIITVNLKEKGKDKGRRLLHVGSMLDYLDRLAASQRAQEDGK
jgi:hypothetical protein